MRLISYNILDGGVGRADPLAEVIEAQRADVVALIEADDALVVERIAARLKMDLLIAQGERHAVALLSRYTILESINHAAIHPACVDTFLEAKLAAPSAELTVALIDLDPPTGAATMFALDALALHRQSSGPHVLMGTFASENAADQIIRAGYADTFTAKNPLSENGATCPTLSPTQRFDRIFTHGIPASNLINAWIETDRLAKYASDHFPVGAEIL